MKIILNDQRNYFFVIFSMQIIYAACYAFNNAILKMNLISALSDEIKQP